MSGPKSSRYTLTAEQLRRILEEQERLRKELEEKARKERERREATEYLAHVRSKAARLVSMVQEYEGKALSVKASASPALQKRYQQLYEKAQQLNSICRTSAAVSHSELIRARGSAEQLFDAFVADGEALIEDTKDWILQQKIQNDERIADGMQLSFASVGPAEEPADPAKERIQTELEALLLIDVSEIRRNEIEHAIKQFETIEDNNARSNFAAITLEPLKRRCSSEARFRKSNRAKYRDASVRYEALCKQLEER